MTKIPCKWCDGSGSLSVGGSTTRYRCTDCGGTGERHDPEEDPEIEYEDEEADDDAAAT